MKTVLIPSVLLFVSLTSTASCPAEDSDAWRLRVSSDGRRLQKANGQDWFWLGDTAWSLFIRLDRQQVDAYFQKRASQKFNVIQCVMVMGYNHSWNAPNAYGHRPFVDGDPTRPDTRGAENFWTHADYIVDRAKGHGLYVAILPAWGSWWTSKFTDRQAATYATWIGNRYKDRENIIWVNGGDVDAADHQRRFNLVGHALHDASPNQLQTFHPRGNRASSQLFHGQAWLDCNMFQSGHGKRDNRSDVQVDIDWAKKPRKPTLDGEQCYEKHPIGWKYTNPSFTDHDVRQVAYWSVFAGAAGVTYGHVNVWIFNDPDDKPEETFDVVMDHRAKWQLEIDSVGAHDMRHLLDLMMSRPHEGRVPDQGLLVDRLEAPKTLRATRGSGYVFVYTAHGDPITLRLGKVPWSTKQCWWYNPRSGEATRIKTTTSKADETFDPPGESQRGNDMVLVIADADRNSNVPGSSQGTSEGE